MERFKIGKININITNIDDTIKQIDSVIKNNIYGYICVTNSRTVYYANKDDAYLKIQNNSLMTVPDGMPLVWIARNKGLKSVDRVCGPDLFPEIIKSSTKKKYSHYFFGSTKTTIDLIKEKFRNDYPNVIIKGAVSPPFQPIESFDIESLALEINKLNPTFFWCGLGAPKQEQLMSLLQPKLNSTICIGVGLVFEYFAETVYRAPKWMRFSGLEWLFRLSQQPKKFSRIIKPYFWIIKQIFKSKFL